MLLGVGVVGPQAERLAPVADAVGAGEKVEALRGRREVAINLLFGLIGEGEEGRK